MQGAYGSEVPHRQFGGTGADVAFSLNEAQNRLLHQLLGIGTSFSGDLRKLRFLLGRETYFHFSRLRKERLRGNTLLYIFERLTVVVPHDHVLGLNFRKNNSLGIKVSYWSRTIPRRIETGGHDSDFTFTRCKS